MCLHHADGRRYRKNAAHREVKGEPLTAIQTSVSGLRRPTSQSEALRSELLAMVEQETNRPNRTVTEAVQMARIDAAS